MRPAVAKNILISFLVFLGLGAICGGATLFLYPSGSVFGMPLSMLANSPFKNFFIPGLLLFIFLGVLPLSLVFPLLTRSDNSSAEKLNVFSDMHWAWSYSIYSGLILIAWLQCEMMFLGAVHWLHTFYMLLAVCIIFTALLPQVRLLYKKKQGNDKANRN